MSRVSIKVIPKSGRSELKRVGNSLKAWLKSAPSEGDANVELVRMLADKFDLPKSAVTIITGFSSRNKVVDISGISAIDIEKIL